MSKKNLGQRIKIKEMTFRELRQILEENGYELKRRANSCHAVFYNTEKKHQILCSGYESGRGRAGRVSKGIVQRVLRECGIQ